MKNKLLMTQLCIAFSLPFIVHSAENVAESASINMESVLEVGRENQKLSAESF